ncbi:helix-turn-helix domain-containing protein [Leptolyngbya sp. KIOST-1]|uniref:helix-turn-helix domain-containing protein n=1 Tax=Leptolyngbya sp. KIOST-1 TaxID=1229172 RepID=UPI00068E781B|nr:AraC family transcriptional regulator [Leptolyngbya sp. KIOST-1]
MTILLSEKDQPASLSANAYLSASSNYELVIQAPQSTSRGYKRSLNLRHGLNFLIRDYWLKDTLVEEKLPEAPGRTLEFGFNLHIAPDAEHPPEPTSQSSFLEFNETRTQRLFQTWSGQRRVLKIDLHLLTYAGCLTFSDDQLVLIPAELQAAIALNEDDWHQPVGSISPTIQLVLQQILNCPYTGSIQQVYLEGKALELIALQTAQWLESGPARATQRLKPSDIDRIHQARDLITQRMDDPPSLLELARAVGLNDCTLKRGFRQVFGTTVFGYLRQQRLIKARQLLQDTEMSVAEVTCQVGYSHAGHFAAAFKREFGISPKAFKNSVL